MFNIFPTFHFINSINDRWKCIEPTNHVRDGVMFNRLHVYIYPLYISYCFDNLVCWLLICNVIYFHEIANTQMICLCYSTLEWNNNSALRTAYLEMSSCQGLTFSPVPCADIYIPQLLPFVSFISIPLPWSSTKKCMGETPDKNLNRYLNKGVTFYLLSNRRPPSLLYSNSCLHPPPPPVHF